MANSIAAALAYLNGKLDAEYKAGAKTSGLDVNPAFVRAADIAGTFYLPSLSMPGLGNIVGGEFPAGAVTQTWAAYTYAYDRGRKIEIESVENAEGAMVSIANAASEYMRLHVIPELDASRIARIATGAGTDVAATITTGADAATAANLALVTLREAEVDDANLMVYMTPTFYGLIKHQVASTGVPCELLDVATVVIVPQTRMYTAITIDAGTTDDAGGYTRATGAESINFIAMDKGAAFADAKHVAERLFSPQVNQGGDKWRWDYRIVHDCWIYAKKVGGVYVHTKDATAS